MFSTWWHNVVRGASKSLRKRRRSKARRKGFRPVVEGLEDRRLLATVAPGTLDPSFQGGRIVTDFGTGRDFRSDPIQLGPLNPRGILISVGDLAVVEGNAGSTIARFNVALSEPSSSRVTVNFATLDGAANSIDTTFNPQDYESTSGILTFLPGETTKSIDVRVLGDTRPELDENFTLVLSEARGATLAESSAVGAILDDDTGPPGTPSPSTPAPAPPPEILSIAQGASVAIEPETGRIVVATTIRNPGGGSDYAVARFLPNGAPDTTFGTDGTGLVTTNFGGATDTVDGASSIALEPGGKIVVAGYTTASTDGSYDFALARYNTNGTLDTTFHGTGRLNIPFLPRLTNITNLTGGTFSGDERATSVIVQADGRIIVGGYASAINSSAHDLANPDLRTTNTDFAVARVNPDGSQDSDFDADGRARFDVATLIGQDVTDSFDAVLGMAVHPSGRIILVGASNLACDKQRLGDFNYTVASLNLLDGTLSAMNNADFFNPSNLGDRCGTNDVSNSVAIRPDGKIAVAGWTDYGDGGRNFGLAVFTEGLTLDGTFNVNGVVATDFALDFNPAVQDEATTIALRPNGNYILGGYSTRGGATDTNFSDRQFAVASYRSDGTLDLLFDRDLPPDQRPPAPNLEPHGQVVTPIQAGSDDVIGTLALQNNGSIVAVGSSTSMVDGRTRLAITRYVGTNDTLPTLEIDNVTITEGLSTPPQATFTVRLSAPSQSPVTVDFRSVDGTARANLDYTPVLGTLTLPPNTTTATISVPILDDNLAEGLVDETFNIVLENPTGANLRSDVNQGGLGTIVDDDSRAVMQFGQTDYVVAESGAFVQVTLHRRGDVSGPSSVVISTRDGQFPTAVGGQDYVIVSRTVSFAAGETTKTLNIPGLLINDDALNELNEQFELVMSGPLPLGARLGSLTTAKVTIVDNDPVPTLSVRDVSIEEGDRGSDVAIVTVALSAASGRQIAVDYSANSPASTATAGVDYVAQAGTLVFAPGETGKDIRITILGDVAPEADESVLVDLGFIHPEIQPNGTPSPVPVAVVEDAQGVITILDNDRVGPINQPTLAISDVAVPEGNTGTVDAVFTVTLSQASTTQVTVNFATANGTATQPDDYQETTGTLIFAPNETSKTIRVPVVGDTLREGNENLLVNLSGAVGAIVSDAQGIGTIQDDDGGEPPPPPPPLNNVTPNQLFIRQVYIDLLRRTADASGEAFWVSILAQGATRMQVVLGIQTSIEYKRVQVQDLFRQYLRRDADEAGLGAFAGALLNGATLEQVTALIIGSQEYFVTRGGGTNEGFLQAVYQDALGRPLDAGGASFFGQLLAQGRSRTEVGLILVTSLEYRQRLVNGFYEQFLRRPADAAGLSFFVAQLQAGVRQETVIATLLASNEYFGRLR